MLSILRLALLMIGLSLLSAQAFAWDHHYLAWDRMLKEHVKLIATGHASEVDYRGFAKDQKAFQAMLEDWSQLQETEYQSWSKIQQLAYLINLYNARTIELILSQYPNIKSIKELGSLFRSPWKQEFVPLFGRLVSLDHIEHGLIRKPGAFEEPRIHFAVNCASVGCPMLRPEAFLPEKLDQQLEESLRRFLSDSHRNRFNASQGRLEVSKLFDWYGQDFSQGHRGLHSLAATFAKYAELLAETPEHRERIQRGEYELVFLDYDWRLNDFRRKSGGRE